MDPEAHTRQLASDAATDGDPTAWFDRLYSAADRGEAVVPWDRGTPSPLLVEWADRRQLHGPGRAVVVGAGYGRDSEYVATLGLETVAFDISPTAVATTTKRFPDSPVDYLTADLLDLPESMIDAFDLVVEDMNVQALPDPMRRRAIDAVGTLVRGGGTLVVIAAGTTHDSAHLADGPPWPLTRAEVEAFASDGLETVSIEQLWLEKDAGTPRWRAEFRRT